MATREGRGGGGPPVLGCELPKLSLFLIAVFADVLVFVFLSDSRAVALRLCTFLLTMSHSS